MADKALTLRLDEATYERLRREAFDQRVTISDIIRDSLTARFKTWDRDDSGPWPASREATRRAEQPTRSEGEDQ